MTQSLLPGMPETDVGGDLDHFQTPAEATQAIIPFLPMRVRAPRSCTLIEPAAGRGAILDVAIPAIEPLDWLAYEIDDGRYGDLLFKRTRYPIRGSVFRADFLTSILADLPGAVKTERPWFFWGNPPYSKATDFVEKCIRLADAPIDRERKGVVAMLLQHDFATGVERCDRIHSKWKSSLYPLKRRPFFGGDGSGKRPFSWFVFDLADPKSEWRPIG